MYGIVIFVCGFEECSSNIGFLAAGGGFGG